jgi:putative tryptophan/tyrosine transport system substrate-binding protein
VAESGAWAAGPSDRVSGGGSAETSAHQVSAVRAGLASLGYIEGHNIVLEYRWAYGHMEPLRGLAADLVAREVALIIAVPSPAALAVKQITTKILVVFTSGVDPVQAGLVRSINKEI